MEKIRNWLGKNGPYLHDKKFLAHIAEAFLFLIIGIFITYFATRYATEKSSGAVTDIILSNTPALDLDGIFIYGPVIFWIIVSLYVLLVEFGKIPFMLKSIALFTVIRSIFTILTHIGPFPGHTEISVSGTILSVFLSGNDLFFSAHTGLPFLAALIFWENKFSRYFCLFSSFFFGAVVLMAHLHYSIDVFAAFFITYAIFRLAQKWFKPDQEFFLGIY
jgi:hypothetical protein